MSQSNFKYCPFCGVQIPGNTVIKYCPFCGEKILVNDNKRQESQSDGQIVVQDQLPQEQLISGNDDDSEINIDKYNRINTRQLFESEYYSIILKSALNKQDLIYKLEKELLRSSFAIRLAVDNIPNIIIYKAKSRDILHLRKIFIEEQASISVIAGDFDDKPSLEELFTILDKLSVEERQIIRKMPINLWLGDSIHGTYPHTYRDNKEGVMVITDKNIYFIPNNISVVDYPWFVRSYNLLSKVVMQENYLELSYKDITVTSIFFADKQKMTDAYQSISRAIQIYKY